MSADTSAPDPGAQARIRIRWGAAAIGAAVDVAGTHVFMLALSAIGGLRAFAVRAQAHDMEAAQAAMQAWLASPSYYAVSLVGGLLWSVAGGYLAAYLAKTAPVLNAASAGTGSAAFALVQLGLGSEPASLAPWNLLLAGTSIPAAMLGGWLVRLVSRRAPRAAGPG